MATTPSPSLAELLEGHVVLDVECFDRIYCNVYQPKLQTPGGVVYFLHDHRGNPIPSPALFRPMGDAYRKAVAAFAEDSGIEMITFPAGERKIDVATSYLQKMSQPGVAVTARPRRFSGSSWAPTWPGTLTPAVPTTPSRRWSGG